MADSPDRLIGYTHDDNHNNCYNEDLQFGDHEKNNSWNKIFISRSIQNNNALQIAKILCYAGIDAHEGYFKWTKYLWLYQYK